MKNKITFCLILFTFNLLNNLAFSQEICMVSADTTTGLDYTVYWEQPADISNLDSVIIYRQLGMASGFFRIGAVKVGVSNPTHFKDINANTIAFSRYAIAFKDNSNSEGPLSLWHQPVVFDYSSTGGGEWLWTQYEIENQLNPSYISEYRCLLDINGTGNFSLLGTAQNNESTWIESNWTSQPTWHYVLETVLPGCTYIEKANINTSRSNIKQQFTNAEAGITETSLTAVLFEILNNPVSDNLTVVFNDDLKNATVWVSGMNGAQYNKSNLTGNEFKMSVSELSQGVYFFNVLVDSVISTKRFIKK